MRRRVEPGDERFTVGLRALAEKPPIEQGKYRPGDVVTIHGQPTEPGKHSKREKPGDWVKGRKAPDTMVLGSEHIYEGGGDWYDTAGLALELGCVDRDGNVAHQKLYPYVRPGVLETYYTLPHLKRWYVVLDWPALRSLNTVHRLVGAVPRKEQPVLSAVRVVHPEPRPVHVSMSVTVSGHDAEIQKLKQALKPKGPPSAA